MLCQVLSSGAQVNIQKGVSTLYLGGAENFQFQKKEHWLRNYETLAPIKSQLLVSVLVTLEF